VGRTLLVLWAEFSLLCGQNSPCSVGRTLIALWAELSLLCVPINMLTLYVAYPYVSREVVQTFPLPNNTPH